MQREPWLERDRAMIDSLKTIGIEKGKPFSRDDKTKSTLEAAVRVARAWRDHKYELVFTPPYNEGARWGMPASSPSRTRRGTCDVNRLYLLTVVQSTAIAMVGTLAYLAFRPTQRIDESKGRAGL